MDAFVRRSWQFKDSTSPSLDQSASDCWESMVTHSFTLTRSLTHTHTRTHTHSLTHTHTHTHTHSHTGAGKTTTFSMLTGDISPTRGTAIISGFDIRTDLRKVYTQNLKILVVSQKFGCQKFYGAG